MKSLVLFNNTGGVGKTTLTFHLAHALSRTGFRVVALDCDPHCNLSAVFLDEDELLEVWEDRSGAARTVIQCVDLVRRGKGGLRAPELRVVAAGHRERRADPEGVEKTQGAGARPDASRG